VLVTQRKWQLQKPSQTTEQHKNKAQNKSNKNKTSAVSKAHTFHQNAFQLMHLPTELSQTV
jgi:hypothetical protein